MDFITFQDYKADIWTYRTEKYLRIVGKQTSTRKERAQTTDYWQRYQSCTSLFGQRLGILPHKIDNPKINQLIAQSSGCLSTAWAMSAALYGDQKATKYIENECGFDLPIEIIQEGLRKRLNLYV